MYNLEFIEEFQTNFGALDDPRVEISKLYLLQEILFIVLCGSLCGSESWRDFVIFWNAKINFLKNYFPFKEGIPCKYICACLCSR